MTISVRQRSAIRFKASTGKIPFDEWFDALKSKVAQAKLAVRIERAEKGLFGDHKGVGEGVVELRDPFGPGYRIYFGIFEDEIILLLLGGDKSSQVADVKKAKEYWADYQVQQSISR